MDKALYISMSGMKQVMRAQTQNSHNMANVGSTGFKADLHHFQEVEMSGRDIANRSRAFVQVKGSGVDLRDGTLVETGKKLDVAIHGNGMMAVQAPDGREAYTRSGSLSITTNGLLINSAGQPVLGNGGPISIPPYQDLEIADDGTISFVPLGQESAGLAVIDRIKLVNTDQAKLIKGNDGLIYQGNGENLDPDAAVKLKSGYIESSNVNIVEAMVNMIDLARTYEMHSKFMAKIEQIDSASSKLLSMS